jgi:predicted nucleic acid-binding protein
VRVLLDTSVLVSALVEAHGRHAQTFPWLQKARKADVEALIASHSMAETYAVLTTLPITPRVTPAVAWALLEHSVLPFVRTVDLAAADVRQAVQGLARQGLAGGVVYDALIAAAALEARADCLLTLNPGDFRRVVTPGTLELREP